jgi:alpha-amylase/alpha-mannosidase (GH57 family)
VSRYICIHGHFYQPPRENPWLEEVELQDSAYPYHDWNEKITAQCYAPNGVSRILDREQRIIRIVNNYSKISFNFGPTLLRWMEKHRPETYEAILEADRLSRERFSGHGSAMAQVYNHMIMPLACKRDKRTQVIWGIEDFKKRFKREPEGMWLPETAADTETLEVLAECGIDFTILAPNQARRARKINGDSDWTDVGDSRIDPSTAYLCELPSGRTIQLFFYDGPISREIAFGDLISNGEAFAQRFVDAFDDSREWPQLVHVATDGETYGHHHRHGDRGLAYCLYFIESNNLAALTNYGEFLERHPPTHYVEIHENSSWSCVHGVERWRNNCGCHSGAHPGWSQAWRKPLREAMDWLSGKAASIYEKEGKRCFASPWDSRDDYIAVVMDRSPEGVERFLAGHAGGELSLEDTTRALSLLEMQRNAMLMFTSCGWFFDEVSGIETVQVIQYAAMVIRHAERLSGESIEPEFVGRLAEAHSNIYENGAAVYKMFAKPAELDLLRVGIHYAVSSLFEDYAEQARIFCYGIDKESHKILEAGKLKLAVGKARVKSDITWESMGLTFAVIHLGDHNISGGVRELQGMETFSAMESEILEAFDRVDVPEVIRLIDKHFGANNFSIWHLFKDEQRKVIGQILELTHRDIEAAYRQIYERAYPIMNFLHGLGIPLPKPFSAAAENIVNEDLKKAFETEEIDLAKLESLISAAARWGLALDTSFLGLTASTWIHNALRKTEAEPQQTPLLEKIREITGLLKPLNVELDLWEAQNAYFSLGEAHYATMIEKAENGDKDAQMWIAAFEEVGPCLHVRFP